MCCGSRADWKREEVPDHKFDFIDVHEFRTKSCFTRLQYVWLYVLILKSFLVYVSDIYTAIALLASNHWAGEILQSDDDGAVKVPFTIGKWIFTGCIIFSFLLLAYEARKAKRIIKSRDISYAYTNIMANNYYSLRSYDHFCFFSNINDSKKKKDEFAFFVFFTFKGWKRLLVADAPRQVINALTLYSFAKALNFTSDFSKYFDGSIVKKGVLLTMAFTVIIFAGSAILLAIAALMYVPLLCYIQGNLKEYCCHKIDKRIAELMKRKTRKRLAQEAAFAKAEARGDYSHLRDKKGNFKVEPAGQPTLPNVDLDDFDDGKSSTFHAYPPSATARYPPPPPPPMSDYAGSDFYRPRPEPPLGSISSDEFVNGGGGPPPFHAHSASSLVSNNSMRKGGNNDDFDDNGSAYWERQPPPVYGNLPPQQQQQVARSHTLGSQQSTNNHHMLQQQRNYGHPRAPSSTYSSTSQTPSEQAARAAEQARNAALFAATQLPPPSHASSSPNPLERQASPQPLSQPPYHEQLAYNSTSLTNSSAQLEAFDTSATITQKRETDLYDAAFFDEIYGGSSEQSTPKPGDGGEHQNSLQQQQQQQQQQFRKSPSGVNGSQSQHQTPGADSLSVYSPSGRDRLLERTLRQQNTYSFADSIADASDFGDYYASMEPDQQQPSQLHQQQQQGRNPYNHHSGPAPAYETVSPNNHNNRDSSYSSHMFQAL